MAADIVKCADLTVPAMHQHNGLAGNGRGEHIARFGHLIHTAGIHPRAREKALVLQPQPFRVGVAGVGQACAALTGWT